MTGVDVSDLLYKYLIGLPVQAGDMSKHHSDRARAWC